MRAEEARAACDQCRWHGARLVAVDVAWRDPRGNGLPEERGERSEDQPYQRGDDDRVTAAAGRDLVRGGVGEDPGRLNVRRQEEQLRVRRLVELVAAQRGLEDQLVRVGDAGIRDGRLDRLDVLVVEGDVRLE